MRQPPLQPAVADSASPAAVQPPANAASVWFPSAGGWDGDPRDRPGSHMWKMTEPVSAWVPKSRSADSLRASHTEDLPRGASKVFSGTFLQALHCTLRPVHWCTLVGVRRVGRWQSSTALQGRCPSVCLPLPASPYTRSLLCPQGAGSQTQPHAAAGPHPRPPGSTGFFVQPVSLRGTVLGPADLAEDIFVCRIICSPFHPSCGTPPFLPVPTDCGGNCHCI